MISLKTRVFRVCCMLVLAISAATHATPGQPGTLDTTFNGTGKVITHIIAGNNFALAAALQLDGKIVLGGTCTTGGFNNFCALRYNANGSLDTSFGGTGKIATVVATTNNLNAVAVQLDGKLVLAGQCSVSSVFAFCARRYNADGTPDNDFGDGVTGLAHTPMGSGSSLANAMVVQPDGKLVLVGTCTGVTNTDFCALRLNADGSPDLSFGTGGKVITAISTQGNGIDRPKAVALQPDGKLVLAGECAGTSVNDFCALRYTANGTLDLTFNGTGWFKVHVGAAATTNVAADVLVQPDGKLMFFGSCTFPFDFCLLRYLANGTPDLSFTSIGFNSGEVVVSPTVNTDTASAMALQPDGKLLLAGQCPPSGAVCGGSCPTADFCVLRLNTDSALDTLWNGTGKVITPVGAGAVDSVSAILLQPDGKVVLTGSCYNGTAYDFCAVRYDGGPFPTPACNLDIDGDGQILGTVDSLIHARIALGMTGNAVTNGIVFPAAAKRNSWALIRTHLNTWCGMSLAP